MSLRSAPVFSSVFHCAMLTRGWSICKSIQDREDISCGRSRCRPSIGSPRQLLIPQRRLRTFPIPQLHYSPACRAIALTLPRGNHRFSGGAYTRRSGGHVRQLRRWKVPHAPFTAGRKPEQGANQCPALVSTRRPNRIVTRKQAFCNLSGSKYLHCGPDHISSILQCTCFRFARELRYSSCSPYGVFTVHSRAALLCLTQHTL